MFCLYMSVLEIRITKWMAVFLKMVFYKILIAVSLKTYRKIGQPKWDFNLPNAEIGWKMANADLFLALYV